MSRHLPTTCGACRPAAPARSRADWWVYIIALAAVALLAAVLLMGCAGVPAVEVCYAHPDYGHVCVAWTGQTFRIVYVQAGAPADADRLTEWVKAQGAPR